MLTEQGWDDLRNLANPFMSAFPNILGRNYTPQNYRFKSTTSERTGNSLKAFLEGLFGYRAYDRIVTLPPDDFLLKVNSHVYIL